MMTARVLLVLGAWLVVSCAPVLDEAAPAMTAPAADFIEESAAGEPALLEEQSSIDNFLANNPAYVWRISTIPVCWESFAQSAERDRRLVQDAVAATWEDHSRLQFDFSTTECRPREDGIRIRVADEGARTRSLGTRIRGVPGGMVLNFTFRYWTPECPEGRDLCVRSIAVHEFGHALGFTHEHTRWDTPAECEAPAGGSAPTRLLTDWDPDSVMNYCNKRPNNHGELSPRDIEGLQMVYGAP